MPRLSRPIRVRWLARPVLHQELDERDRHATWLELFFDLVYVVMISLLARDFAHDFTPGGLGRLMLLAVPCWWSWVGFTVYKDRFDVDAPSTRLVTLLQIAAAANLALHVPGGTGVQAASFAIAYALARGLLVVLYLHTGATLPRARELGYHFALGYGLAALMWLGSAFVSPENRPVVWVLAIALDLATPFASARIQANTPVNFSHLPERFGLFTIIVLGESVAAVIRGRVQLPDGGFPLTDGFLALTMAFSFWWIYYDNLVGKLLRDMRVSGPIWLYGHLFLAVGLVCVSVGTEHVLALPPGQAVPWMERLAMGGGMAVCLVILGMTHQLVKCPDHAFKARVRYAGAAVAVGLVVIGMGWSAIGWRFALAALMAAQVLGEFRRRTRHMEGSEPFGDSGPGN